jgi:hypothetical protein
MKTASVLLITTSLCAILGGGRVCAVDALDIWLPRPVPSRSCYGITHGNGLFVTVGFGGTILTSTTGAAWTNQISGTTLSLQDVTCGNGLFVAVGGENVTNIILTSLDGRMWTSRGSHGRYPLNSVAYGNGGFVAVGDAGVVMTSVDGISWVLGPGTRSTRCKIAYGNGTFVAVGYSTGFSMPNESVQISTNGVTWTKVGPAAQEQPWTDDLQGAVFAGGFVAVGGAGAILTSPDGNHWTRQQPITSESLYGVACGNGYYVAVGNHGTVLTSTNGVTWTNRQLTDFDGYLLKAAGYANGTFVVVGGTIWQSANTTLGGSYSTTKGNSLSVDLGPFSGVLSPYGQVTNYVTTYDGSVGVPLQDALTNGQFRTSGELRPRTNQAGWYEADYLTRGTAGSLVQYGRLTMSFPVVDSDTNGVPDVLQPDKPGDMTITGDLRIDWPVALSATLSGSTTRSPGFNDGTYNIIISSSFGTSGYSGNLYLPQLEGYVTFSRGSSNVMRFELARRGGNGKSSELTGASPFLVTDTNHLSFPPFTLSGTDGSIYTVLPMTLFRWGNKYRGELQFGDGDPVTTWVDYQRWILEIADNDDSNTNGVPDLSDTWSPSLRAFIYGGKFIIAWPASAPGSLEACASLSSPFWETVVSKTSLVGGELQVAQPVTGGSRFYRLRAP